MVLSGLEVKTTTKMCTAYKMTHDIYLNLIKHITILNIFYI